MTDKTDSKERADFIHWHMDYLLTDEALAAHVWDNDHVVAQSWHAAFQAGRASLAANAGSEPVAGGAIAEVVMTVRPPNASPAWLPHKIIYASLQWLDSAPVGTKLYTHPSPPEGMVGGWRPIETAPKDGSVIIAFYTPRLGKVHSGCYATAMYECGHWCNPDDDEDWYSEPTHWMPLPEAPNA